MWAGLLFRFSLIRFSRVMQSWGHEVMKARDLSQTVAFAARFRFRSSSALSRWATTSSYFLSLIGRLAFALAWCRRRCWVVMQKHHKLSARHRALFAASPTTTTPTANMYCSSFSSLIWGDVFVGRFFATDSLLSRSRLRLRHSPPPPPLQRPQV